jgi:hypothetical protein
VIEALKKVPLSNFKNLISDGFNDLIPLLAQSTDISKVCEIMRLLPGLAFEKMAELPGKEGWVFLQNMLNAVESNFCKNVFQEECQLAFCLALPLNLYFLFSCAAQKIDKIDCDLFKNSIKIHDIIFLLSKILEKQIKNEKIEKLSEKQQEKLNYLMSEINVCLFMFRGNEKEEICFFDWIKKIRKILKIN